MILLGGCVVAPPPPSERVLPISATLVRDGLAANGDEAVLLAGCRPVLLRIAPGGRRDPPPSPGGAACAAAGARAAPGGRLVATHDGRSEVRLWRAVNGELAADTGLRLAPTVSLPFPPPGPNLAFGADGGSLLVGALNRGCSREAGGLRCGMAELFASDGTGWRSRAVIAPPGDAAAEVRFGQAVALAADGRAALVGGTGRPGRSGALWLFALEGPSARVMGVLRPDREDPWFATDLALAEDGSWLAVGGAQAVYLFEAKAGGFRLARRLRPPDRSAGYFGEAVSLAADGRTLLVGAPRASCAAGRLCGRAYLYRREAGWSLAATIEPALPAAEANFGRKLALDRAGHVAAVQGASLHVFELR